MGNDLKAVTFSAGRMTVDCGTGDVYATQLIDAMVLASTRTNLEDVCSHELSP